ncbi:MAG: hypothetical protein R6W66_02660 [Pelovirga sp.]
MSRPAFQPVPVHSDIDRLASEITPLACQIQAEEQSQKRVSAETWEVPFEVNECFRLQALLEHSRADALSAITEQFLATDWACGASLATVPEDKRGTVLNIGRRSRTFPRKRAPPRCATLRRMSMPERQ